MKIAIVTDSNSGITQAQAGELGIFVLPMPFMINEATFEEDINLTHEEFYKRQAEDADITTSQPSPQDVTDLWDKLFSEGYDQRLKRLLPDSVYAGRGLRGKGICCEQPAYFRDPAPVRTGCEGACRGGTEWGTDL